MTEGQSVPCASAASSATVRSASGAGRSCESCDLRAERPTGFIGEAWAASAADKSSSVMVPAFTSKSYAARERVILVPATRAIRAAAMEKSSPICPRKGFTATVAERGKAGGMARAAASAALRRPETRPGAIIGCLRNMRFFL